MKRAPIAAACLLLLLLTVHPAQARVPTSAPATDFTEFHDPFAETAPEIADPLEPLNRAAFWLNDRLYTRILQPLCDAAPVEIQAFLATVLERGQSPLQLGGVELQFKFRDAGSEFGRFILHGLIGLLDRVDPETTAALATGDEDFGRALESFGLGSGFYLVLPVFGPSSLRDGMGWVASVYLEPSPQMFNLRGSWRSENKSLLGDLKAYEAIRRDSLDPYLFIRNAYAQQREGGWKEIFSQTDSPRRLRPERVAALQWPEPR